MKILNLKTNHLINPVGYDFETLHFNWEVQEANQECKEFHLVVSKDVNCMKDIIYDSQIIMDYAFNTLDIQLDLEPRTRYYWNVTIVDVIGQRMVSDTAYFETAKMEEAFLAKWISADSETAMPFFYKNVLCKKEVKTARIYACGLGLYEIYMNDTKVGDEYLLPGYHSYDYRLEYQTFDVTNQLKQGENALSILMGNGWYKGRFGFDHDFDNLYGDKLKVLLELHIEYTDGEKDCVYTDDSFMACTSQIFENNIYDGEHIDMTAKKEELSVSVLDDTTSLLVGRSNPPIRKVAEFEPVVVSTYLDNADIASKLSIGGLKGEDSANVSDASGAAIESKSISKTASHLLLDFGEVITGWVEITGIIEKSYTLTLQYGEVLQNGAFYNDNLRTAKAEFCYTSNGEMVTMRPHFTYYGFQFVKVTLVDCNGVDLPDGKEVLLRLVEEGKLTFTAYRIMSDMEQTGTITTSNAMVNKLVQNTLRSQQCNFLDIPTDCPQRDERMGWTGDTTIFAPTACFHMDSAAFYNHYLHSLKEEQKRLAGSVPFFVPMPKVEAFEGINPFYVTNGACVWGDVATVLPWTLYLHYGDKSLLKQHFGVMCDWIDYITKQVAASEDAYLWKNGHHLGDWLALDNGNPHNPIGKTNPHMIANVFYYQSALLCAKAANVIQDSRYEEYLHLAEMIKSEFIKEYFDDNDCYVEELTQTACALLLHFQLYPKVAKEYLVKSLEELLIANDGHLNSGFVGTPFLCQALSDNNLNDWAYKLLLNEEYPGWLFEVKLGATTVWERWNSLLEDGSISGTGMNSLNHYAYGSIAEWMYRYVLGFSPRMGDEVKMLIAPKPSKLLAWAKGRIRTPYGEYESEWHVEPSGEMQFKIMIPFNANAEVVLPDGSSRVLKAGEHCFSVRVD
ncbi:family 78 glycoside hydrolase catalytic domain [Anaerosporobacter sp.]|uniref:family 78 glycoside hydrolase catalytic domain n=1 Tax=Anaerosporobacter sp. TaxID=1872529 RepID=UPI00286F7E19|nr:family 78 glycoside hydrolase catalytic domain [Anaerosporobacter sp.]